MLQMKGFPSVVWLNNFQLCIHTTFSLHTHPGYLSRFLILVIVNMAINMGMHISLQLTIPTTAIV